MRRLAFVASLLLASSASAAPFRLPLDGCEPKAETCRDGTKPCYITAYYDLDTRAGTAFQCTSNCLDWNCEDNSYDGHVGTDIGVQYTYDVRPVVAGNQGTVIERNDGCADRNSSCETCGGGFGNYVKLRHPDGQETIYGHMAKGSVQVVVGQSVACGQLLGRVASSGCSTGPHLHFEVIDPRYGSDDPFKGNGTCGGTLTYWFNQGAYCSLPGTGGCTVATSDDAHYVAETIPDNTELSPGASFTKTWTMKNAGTSTWTAGAGYAWVFDGEELLGASSQKIALPAGESIKPGATRVWSVAMKAPTTPGIYRGYWRMDKGGTRFGDRVWVQIVVKGGAATNDDARFVSETIPDGTSFPGGASFTKTWTMRNSGTTTWTAAGGYGWVFDSQEQFGASPLKVQLAAGESIAPGQTRTWSVAMKAPAEAGRYRSNWRMDKGGTRFGDLAWAEIVVDGGLVVIDDAVFVSETIPDDTHFSPGAKFTKTWTMKNAGTSTWSAPRYRWAWDGMEQFGATSVSLGASEQIKPGASKTWSVPMTAPADPGTYRGYWRMDHEGNGRFGVQVRAQIIVDPPSPVDKDGDGHASIASGGDDCDDGDPDVHPFRPEDCDGKDNDCDGLIDEGLVRSCDDACGGTESCVNGRWSGCAAPAIVPEVCNGRDDDCDGVIDNDVSCDPGFACIRGRCVGSVPSDAGAGPDASRPLPGADAGANFERFDGGGCGCGAAAAGPAVPAFILLMAFGALRRRR